MDLNENTICACTSCGFPVVGEHDCVRQIAENANGATMSNFERVIFMNARGALIARIALARSRS